MNGGVCVDAARGVSSSISGENARREGTAPTIGLGGALTVIADTMTRDRGVQDKA